MRRQYLTVLFTDLCRSTLLGRRIEAEEHGAVLARVRELWHAAAGQHGGVVVRTQGDGALIVFGLAGAGELDGLHAVDTALAIHEAVAQLDLSELSSGSEQGCSLLAHSGIHAGQVVIEEGDFERGRYDLFGDIPNTAAKLQATAQPGQIIATLVSLGPHVGLFRHERVDGREAAAEAAGPAGGVLRVLGRARVARRFDATVGRGLTPLLGREEVLSQLADFMAMREPAAVRGPAPTSRCVMLTAMPGMGKTRLLEELALSAWSSPVLRGTCEFSTSAEVLQPFAQMLRTPPAELREWLPPSIVAGCLSSPSVDGLRALLADMAQRAGGLVLFVDDWQWADDASRRLLRELLDASLPLRVLIAARPQEDGAAWLDNAVTIKLRALNEDESEVAVKRWLPDADPFLTQRIHAYSGGVPLFIEELCNATSAGVLAQALEGQRLAHRGWGESLVTSRLGRLPTATAQVLRAAAVIGAESPLPLLAEVCGFQPDAAMLDVLAEADLLHADAEGRGVRFKHGITRDAVYGAIDLPERRLLHRRALQALTRDDCAAASSAPEVLANHSWGASLWAVTIDHAELAGDRAAQAHAIDRAREHYRRALLSSEKLIHPDESQRMRACRLAHKLGMACIFDPLSIGDDLALFERAVSNSRSLADPALEARCLYWLGYIEYALGRYIAGRHHMREALALARLVGDAPLESQVNAALGEILHATCDYDEAISLIDVAVAAKRERSRPGSGVAVGSAYALACKGSMLADRGDFSPAWICFDEAIRLLGDSAHPVGNSVRNWYTVACIWAERWDAAERIAAQSVAIAEHTRALLLLAIARSTLGYAQWRRGDAASGLQLMNDAVAWLEARSGRMYTSLHFAWLAEACAQNGHFQPARKLTAHVLRRARQGERLGEAIACRAMARAEVETGGNDRARRWLARAESAAAARQSPREQALNAQLAKELGGSSGPC